MEYLKFLVYRAPIFNRLMSPKYPYKIDPGELTELINIIDVTRGSGGAIVEVGVAQGDTSVFLLEHLKTTGDERTLLLYDTFEGFTDVSIKHEVSIRDKEKVYYDSFRYGNEKILGTNLKRRGYSRFRIYKGDASQFDWSAVAPIAAVLLDVDLYIPTLAILNNLWPYLVTGGGIVVDDCLPDTPWDGALQAYTEFIAAKNLPFIKAGQKGAVAKRPYGKTELIPG